MKKAVIASLIALAGVMPATAQTEFRHITFDEAKTAAKAEGKLIFADFYTQWCGPCKRMASTVFPKKEIGDYLNPSFVCLKLDAEAEGAELAKTVGVNAYPTFVVFDAGGNVLGSFAGMKDGQEFITAVEMCKNPDLSPERVKERYESGERNAKLVQAYALNIADSSRDYMSAYANAGKVLDEYFDSLNDDQRVAPENHFLFDSYTTGYNTPRIQYAIANRNRFDASKAGDIAEILKNEHNREASRYFTNNAITDDATRKQYESFKKNVGELGYTSDFATAFSFIEARASMDTDAYLKFCEKNYEKLNEEDRSRLLISLSRVFTPANEEQVKKVSAFARKRIGELPAQDMMWVGQAIYELESPNKH